MISDDEFHILRQQMVEQQIVARGIHNGRVLNAMRKIPRHQFVPAEYQDQAYADHPLPIGENQTISQPYICAAMTQELHLSGHERVLEIGTGSGYQTALLCELAAYVYSIEWHVLLAERAAHVLNRLGYQNIDIHAGDGSQGLPDMSPFDAIVVTAAAPSIPGPLCSQLNQQGGRLVLPVGDKEKQMLQRVLRDGDSFNVENLLQVKFVPLVGRYGFKAESDSLPDDFFDGG